MDKKTKLVLELLKPKAKSLGFTKEELEGVATKIANNLGLDDNATDEQLNAAATKEVDAAIFHLELAQSHANRLIQKKEEERKAAEDAARRKAEAEAAAKAAEERKAKEEAERKKAEEEERKKAEEEGLKKFLDSDFAKNMKAENDTLSKQLREQQEAAKKAQEEFAAFRDEFNKMKAEKVKNDREKKLTKLLDGTGVFGDRVKKNFSKMTFDTDEEFEDFCSGVEEDIKAFNQERANVGLEQLSAPAASGAKATPKKAEPMTDAEIDALAEIM